MSLRKPVLALAALALTLLVGEAMARLFLAPPRYHNEPLELESELGFRGVANYRDTRSDAGGDYPFALDSEGLRGRGLSRPDAAGEALRVVFLGDSFLFTPALRDEHLMTSRTAAALAERGIDAEVANLSASDYGTGQELLLLRRLGSRLRPDVVVLALYPGNDLANNSLALAGATRVSVADYIRPYVVSDAGRLRVRWTHPLRSWLRRHSRLFAGFEWRLLVIGAERRIPWLMPWPPSPGQGARLHAGGAPREDLELFRRPAPGSRWEAAWKDTFSLLRVLRNEVEALGARLLVLVIPSVEQVQSTAKSVALDLAVRRATGDSLARLLDWNLPERRLARFFEAEGIEARLLLMPLRDAVHGGAPVYERDGHLSPRGHEVAAAVVTDWLQDASAPLQGISGRPIDRHSGDAEAPAVLAFRHDDHASHVGDGWLGWRREAGEAAGGWELGRRGLLVLPDRAGELVVRGVLSPQAALPVALNVEVAWGPQRGVRLERPGPFEVRLPARDRNPPGAGDHAVVVLGQGALLEHGIVVQEVGFESPAPDGGN